jgi:thioredoxin-related protein
MHKKIELLANLAIIIAAFILGVVLVKQYLLAGSVGGANRLNTTGVVAGAKVSLAGVNWEQNGQTILLVLSPGCRYCTQSAAFYQRLAREAAGGRTKPIAVFPVDDEGGRRYLDELQVPIREVRQASLDAIGVRGTPTLILIDKDGVVTDVWVGMLPPEQESEVLSRVRGGAQAGGSQ